MNFINKKTPTFVEVFNNVIRNYLDTTILVELTTSPFVTLTK